MNYKLENAESYTNKTILYIHGWNSKLETMEVLSCCNDKYNLLFIDLPGCGKTNEPKTPLKYEDYLEEITNLTNFLNLKICFIVTHSFGGKLAIGLSEKYDTLQGLFLICPSIIKPRRTIKYYFKIYTYKLCKKLKLLKYFKANRFGSVDYQNASDVMKKTLINILNISLEEKLKNIDLPTILLWAKDDQETKINLAKKAHKLLKNSSLIVIDGPHFAYYFQARYVTKILISFIKGVEKDDNC